MAKPKNYTEYNNYITSDAWRETKERYWHSIRYHKLINDKNWAIKCSCGFKSRRKGDFHVHHRTYRNFTKEHVKELLHLCPTCHDKVHNKARNLGITMFKNKTWNTGSNQTHLWQITKDLQKENNKLRKLRKKQKQKIKKQKQKIKKQNIRLARQKYYSAENKAI